MSELSVDLVTPTGMVLEATLLPDDMRTEEVISELVDELNLPRLAANGQVITYSLEVVGQGGLPAGQSLRDAGVSNGDRLRLSTNHVLPLNPNAPRPQGPLADPAPTTNLAPGMLEVVLAVLDLNKSEKTALHADRPVAELIQQIAANYNLPARDKLNEVITYRLESKALGRYLANRETLQQAGIPRLDRLSLHREEHAGGRRKEEGGRRKEEGGRRKEEGGTRGRSWGHAASPARRLLARAHIALGRAFGARSHLLPPPSSLLPR